MEKKKTRRLREGERERERGMKGGRGEEKDKKTTVRRANRKIAK